MGVIGLVGPLIDGSHAEQPLDAVASVVTLEDSLWMPSRHAVERGLKYWKDHLTDVALLRNIGARAQRHLMGMPRREEKVC